MSETATATKPLFARSFETQQLVQRFSAAKVGETIPYTELTALIGEDVQQDRGRSKVGSAIRIMQNEYRWVFVPVRGVGIQRADSQGIMQTGSQRLQHIHRTASRAMKTLGCVDPTELDVAGRQEFNEKASHLGMLAHCSSPKATKRLGEAVKQVQQKLPLDKTLTAFLEKDNGKST